MKSIQGKTALVTGGAGGIGRLLALGLAGRGAKVVVWDLDELAMSSLEAEAKERGLDVRCLSCDVSKRAEVYAKAEETAARFGPVYLLVNNAGIVSGKRFLDTPDERIEKLMSINAMAHFWTAKAFLPAMIERDEGHVVTISSAAGIIGVTGLADYSASKFAAFGFAEALRMELRKARSKVRTTIVCPFFIDTGLFEGVRTRFSLLLPILRQDYVARRILGAILRGKKRLTLPWFVYSVWLLRLFPVGFLDAMAGFFGINSSMDEFKGRANAK
jgi:all-trans-retinol dehydrogenase (NAD+)